MSFHNWFETRFLFSLTLHHGRKNVFPPLSFSILLINTNPFLPCCTGHGRACVFDPVVPWKLLGHGATPSRLKDMAQLVRSTCMKRFGCFFFSSCLIGLFDWYNLARVYSFGWLGHVYILRGPSSCHTASFERKQRWHVDYHRQACAGSLSWPHHMLSCFEYSGSNPPQEAPLACWKEQTVLCRDYWGLRIKGLAW